MDKLTFLPPPIGEDFSIHLTQDQAAILGLEDNYILYSMIAADESPTPTQPPVLVMSLLDHNAWSSLFVASFTLNKRPGQLRTLLASFLQEHDLYIRFITAAEATTGSSKQPLANWIFPTVQVIFELGHRDTTDPVAKALREWTKALQQNVQADLIQCESTASTAIQKALPEAHEDLQGSRLDWISPLRGHRAMLGATADQAESLQWHKLRAQRTPSGGIAISLRPVLTRIFPEVRFDRNLLTGVQKLPYIPFVAADLGDRLITLHHFHSATNAILDLDVSLPASGHEDLWLWRVLDIAANNKGNMLGLQTSGRFEEHWLKCNCIFQFTISSIKDLLHLPATLAQLDRHHSVVDGTLHRNRHTRLLDCLPQWRAEALARGLSRRQVHILRADVLFNQNRAPIVIRGESLADHINPADDFDYVRPLTMDRYRAAHGAAAFTSPDTRGQLAIRIVKRLNEGHEDHPIRIGLIGGHRVGKTSLLQLIRDELLHSTRSFTMPVTSPDGHVSFPELATIHVPIHLSPTALSHTSLEDAVAEQLVRAVNAKPPPDASYQKVRTPATLAVRRAFSPSLRFRSVHSMSALNLADQEYLTIATSLQTIGLALSALRHESTFIEACHELRNERAKLAINETWRLHLAEATFKKFLAFAAAEAGADPKDTFTAHSLASTLTSGLQLNGKSLTGKTQRCHSFASMLHAEWLTSRAASLQLAARDALPENTPDAPGETMRQDLKDKLISALAKAMDSGTLHVEVERFLDNEHRNDGQAQPETQHDEGGTSAARPADSATPPLGDPVSQPIKTTLNRLAEKLDNLAKECATGAVEEILKRYDNFLQALCVDPASKPRLAFVFLVDWFPAHSPWADPRVLAAIRANVEGSRHYIKWIVASSHVDPNSDSEPLGQLSYALFEYNLDRIPQVEADHYMRKLGATESALFDFSNKADKEKAGEDNPAQTYLTPGGKNLVLAITGRYAYLLQLTCFHLHEKARTRYAPVINRSMIREVVQHHILPELTDFFERHWRGLAPFHDALKAYAVLVGGGTWIRAKHPAFLSQPPLNSKCIKALERAGLVREDLSGVVPLFAEWIKTVKA